MAPLSATKQVLIHASPEVVWQVHTDINAWSQSNRSIPLSRTTGPLAVGSTFKWKSGGLTIASVIQTLVPVRHISWTGKSIDADAEHTWTFLPQDGGTLVTSQESMRGWLVSLLKLLISRFLDKSLDEWLQALKAKSEAVSKHPAT